MPTTSKEIYCYRILKAYSLIVDFDGIPDRQNVPSPLDGETYGQWQNRVLGDNVSNVVLYSPDQPRGNTLISTLQNRANAKHLKKIFRAVRKLKTRQKKSPVHKTNENVDVDDSIESIPSSVKIYEQLQEANSQMNKCNSSYNSYLISYELILSLIDGVKIQRYGDQKLFSDLLDDISTQIEDIRESYISLGLISEDEEAYDEISFLCSKIERKIANRKIRCLAEIPENMRDYFPSEQSEFEQYRESLIDSGSIWDDIKMSQEVLQGYINLLGENPFSELLGDFGDNVEQLASNLDYLFEEFIKKVNEFCYF